MKNVVNVCDEFEGDALFDWMPVYMLEFCCDMYVSQRCYVPEAP